MEYGNGLYIKRDDKTIKSIAVLYRYIDILPLTRNQRVQILHLIEAALTNAETTDTLSAPMQPVSYAQS